jgi:hypothetical protein
MPVLTPAAPAAGESGDHDFFQAAVRTPSVPWDLEGMKPSGDDDRFAPLAAGGPIGFPDEEEGSFSSFGGSADGDGAPQLFVADRELTAVAYGAPEDVVELQTSINVARITPDGELPQNSNAYICAVRRGEAVHVYVALHLLQSGRVIVYAPEAQPADDDYRRTLRGAVGFAEAVGFMMDGVALSDEPAQRAEALKRVPVMRTGKA